MIIRVPGHSYDLAHLKGTGYSTLHFYKDPELHGGSGFAGTSNQEVTRALIDRVGFLHTEKPHPANDKIIYHYRMALAYHESRAIELAVEKGLAIELLPTNEKGHIWPPLGYEFLGGPKSTRLLFA